MRAAPSEPFAGGGQKSVDDGSRRGAPVRPPRANSADMDTVHADAAMARETSGEALSAIHRWRGIVFRSPSGGVYPIGVDAALDEGKVPTEEEGEGEQLCLFDLLPPEMLSAVLSWLDWKTLLKAAPAVCKRWRAVCRDLVPAKFEFPYYLSVGDRLLQAIWTRFRTARGVTLGWCHGVTSGAVQELAMQCRQLRQLKLTSARMDITQLVPAVLAMPNLRVLG